MVKRRILATPIPNAARESSPGTVRPVRHCATIPDAARALCGEAGVISSHCAACSRPSSMSCPSKGHGDTHEECTAADLAPDQGGAATQGERSTSPPSPLTLCVHLRLCAAIPGPVRPSPVMWNHSRHCAALYIRDITASSPVQLELAHHQDPRASVRTTTRREHQSILPSKSSLHKHRSRHVARGSRDSPSSRPRARIRQDNHHATITIRRYSSPIHNTATRL
jgi:hypothetical protein